MLFTMYITTPIYYVNDVPHIGHAYTSIVSDTIARFNRLNNKKVKFSTGTDEHGQKIQQSAIRNSLSPQEFTDKISNDFFNLTKLLNLTNNDFIRTTEERHKKSVQSLWERIENNGHIYKGHYEGWYSVRDEAFYQEQELIDRKAPTGASVEWMKESSFFFKLSDFQDKLLKLYNDNPNFIYPATRYNEVVSFVESGLQDISISRTSFTWGINVPGHEEHIIYVWLDALSNYLTVVGFPNLKSKDYINYWQNDDIIHVIGKDILRFHAVYWPSFLMAADLPIPKTILTHGWWTNDGEKISKSLGNVINPVKLVEDFSVDYVRYFLMREISFGYDGNFSETTMINRINSELANNIGNLIHRTLVMVNKNCNAKVPKPQNEQSEILTTIYELSRKVCNYINNYEFHEAITYILKMSSLGNEYIDKRAPWKFKKDNPTEMGYILSNLLEIIRCIGILLQPFIPDSAKKILDQLFIKENERNISNLNNKFTLKPGANVANPEVIFSKIK